MGYRNQNPALSLKISMCEASPTPAPTPPDSATQIDQLLKQVRKILLETWSQHPRLKHGDKSAATLRVRASPSGS